MASYCVRDLKRQFPELRKENDFTLVPLMDIVLNRWIRRIRILSKGIVSDVRKEEESDSRTCVVNGKIVDAYLTYKNIDVKDDDEIWYMAEDISFSVGNYRTGCRFLTENLREFVGKQRLDNLVELARRKLMKRKIDHLNAEMQRFYRV